MTSDMFATLERATRLIEQGKQEEAYALMKASVEEDVHGFARIFLKEWVRHLRGEDEQVQIKFAPIVSRLQADFPIIAPPEPPPGSVTTPALHAIPKVIESALYKESLSLSFYDWQMTSIEKAAIREKVDATTLLTRMLETGNLDPLTWKRYKRGNASPDRLIRVKVSTATKDRLNAEKDAENLTLTKYVRKFLFGERAERY